MTATRPVSPETCERIDEVWRRLGDHYGHPTLQPTGDPREQLVLTILSQHTTDASADRAYAELRTRFPVWPAVENASVEEIADAIRLAGLARQKSATIQGALCNLQESDLAGLAALSVPEARARLTSLRGVGDKTASCVLLFALGMPAQPVDTHIERVSKRVGFTNGERTATGIQNVLETCLPADGQTMYAFHVDLIRLGREVCRARTPDCSVCILNDICNYYAETSLRSDT